MLKTSSTSFRMLSTTALRGMRAPVARNFSSSASRLAEETVVVKPKRRIGAFRGGFVGFLLGTVVTGLAGYSYLADEYRAGSTVVIEDVANLQASIRKLESHVLSLEKKIDH